MSAQRNLIETSTIVWLSRNCLQHRECREGAFLKAFSMSEVAADFTSLLPTRKLCLLPLDQAHWVRSVKGNVYYNHLQWSFTRAHTLHHCNTFQATELAEREPLGNSANC